MRRNRSVGIVSWIKSWVFIESWFHYLVKYLHFSKTLLYKTVSNKIINQANRCSRITESIRNVKWPLSSTQILTLEMPDGSLYRRHSKALATTTESVLSHAPSTSALEVKGIALDENPSEFSELQGSLRVSDRSVRSSRWALVSHKMAFAVSWCLHWLAGFLLDLCLSNNSVDDLLGHSQFLTSNHIFFSPWKTA